MSQRVTEYVPAPLSYETESATQAPGWEGVTLAEIFRILRRRMALIAATTLIFAVAAGAAAVIIKPLYPATTPVLIDPRRPNVINLDAKQAPVQAPATDDATIESQVLLAQSVSVLRRRWVISPVEPTPSGGRARQASPLFPVLGRGCSRTATSRTNTWSSRS